MEPNNIEIYQTADGETRIDVRFERDTLWLTQAQMAELFDKDSDTIGLHLKNIYESGELEENSTTEDSSVVRQEGKRQVKRKLRSGLAALTLLVAESDPKQKETLIRLIMNMLAVSGTSDRGTDA